MTEVIDVLIALGTPLKIAWVVWLAWGVGQYVWFRQRRSMPAKTVTSVAKPAPAPKKVKMPKTVAAQAAEAPIVGRLITPSYVTADAKPSAPVTPPVQPEPVAIPAPQPMPVAAATAEAAPAPTFDPSQAVIEQFGAMSDDVLDKFVRDFEMQDARPRRRKTTPLSGTPSYGAEAPQVP